MTQLQKNKRAINAILKAMNVDPKAPWPYLPKFVHDEIGPMRNDERWYDLLQTHGMHITLYEMALEYGDNTHRC